MSVNGDLREIQNEFAELKALLATLQVQKVQYADKIYNIAHISEANFGVVVSGRVFNAVLAKELIPLLWEKPEVGEFLDSLPDEDKENWECVRSHLKEAQGILEKQFVWLIGWELRRLFSIGNDPRKSMEIKISEYMHHCFGAYRLSLQLMNFLFLSKLWDSRIQNLETECRAGSNPEALFLEKAVEIIRTAPTLAYTAWAVCRKPLALPLVRKRIG